MPDEKLEVEMIAQDTGILKLIEKQTKFLDKLEKKFETLGQTSEKSAKAAAGSFNALEKELKEAEAALRAMKMGTEDFDAQRKKVDALRSSMQRAKTAIKGISDQKNIFKEIGTSIGIATGAAGLLYAALSKIADAQRQIVKDGADAAVTIDSLARRMQVQAGLTDQQRQGQSQAIIRQASEAGVQAEVGFRAATQAVSSGFQDPVNTGILKTILDTMQASNVQGGPEDLIKAFSQALNAYGLEKTNQNLQGVAVAAQGLFKVTDFQLSELSDFAKNAAVFESAGMQLNEAIAGFTALRETLPAEQAGTGLRNFVSILQTAAGTKERRDMLEKMSLKPEQVDFVGENLSQVITTLKTATEKMDAAERNVALGKLFGMENVASAKLLMGGGGRIQQLQNMQQNRAQFEADRAVAAGGMQAERNRIENERMMAVMANSDALNALNNTLQRREDRDKTTIEKATVEGGALVGSATQVAVKAAQTVDSVLGQGASEAAARSELTGAVSPSGNAEVAKGIMQLMGLQREAIDETRKQTAILQQQAQQANRREPQRPPAATRPKAAPLPAATAP